MRCNPGGTLAPEQVFGRDALIERIWSALDTQSLLLTAERRMGKTSILNVLQKRPRPGFRIVKRDLEDLRSCHEFANRVIEDIQASLAGPSVDKLIKSVIGFMRKRGLTEVGSVRLPDTNPELWKDLLVHALTSWEPEGDDRLVLLLDEFPLFLLNLKSEKATEVLDTLRHVRQTNPRIRMVLTGSIGIHNALHRLRAEGYANAPVNDVRSLDVPPLDERDAVALARELLVGERIPCKDLDAVSYEIATGVSAAPFFIQHVVAALQGAVEPVRATDIATRIEGALRDPASGWDLPQYRHRIDTYYEDEHRAPALAILDATATGSRTHAEVEQALAVSVPGCDEETRRRLLEFLRRDHYLRLDEDERYRFRLAIVARWWRIERGL